MIRAGMGVQCVCSSVRQRQLRKVTAESLVPSIVQGMQCKPSNSAKLQAAKHMAQPDPIMFTELWCP